MFCHGATCLALELETLAHDSFHLARNGNHKILLSMLCEGIMREDSVEMVLVLSMCIFETHWAAQPEIAVVQDLQKQCIYNNVKYRELKHVQVTCSFAPPGTPGQSTPRGQGLPYSAACSLAQQGPVLWE